MPRHTLASNLEILPPIPPVELVTMATFFVLISPVIPLLDLPDVFHHRMAYFLIVRSDTT